MNKHLRFIYLLLLLFGLNIQTIKAQSDFASEEEFKKQAAKLFDEEEFEKAYPLYSQLVSLYRKDPNYNYRLGVCMLYASDEKERAITFLEFATKNKDVEKEAFFYLAKAYHLNYRFDDAIGQYQAYKKMASGAKAERFQVDRQIEMCNNGKKLLRNISDLPVIEKTEISREDFFRSYDIAEIGGKMLVKPDEKEFRTALDKKKKEKSILYLATNSNQIYFSSYGDNEQTGKNIFLMKKTPSGEWGKPQTIGNTVNTKYDEDFPFLHPNGKVLYFSSKGHNSMGGYDIFKTTLNEETNLWNTPVNMDFPINTPDDDILYVTNADEKKAFFASARSSVAGKIAVYHITVERRPIDFAIIRGAVIKNHKDQALNIKITVKNVNDNSILGIFNSTPKGSYDIKLPNGGSFLYTVESPDFATQSEIVTVPVQTEFKPLKQEIIFELPTDKLKIKNLFDEAISDSNYLLAINVIKEKAKMDVIPSTESVISSSKEDSVSASETAIVQQTTTPKTTKTLSNDDIIKIAYNDASIVDTEATTAKEQANIAMSFANQKNEHAQIKSKEADALMASASATDDNVKKQALTDEANAARTEAERLNKETVVAFNLAKRIDATAAAKKEEADLSLLYAKELEVAVKSKNSTESLSKLDELEKRLDALSLINADRFPVLNSYKKEEENKKRELDRTIQTSSNLKKDIADNETIISNLKIDADNTKNSQIKQGLDNQIAELALETTNKQKELEQNEIRKVKVEKEYSSIKNEADLVSSVVDQSKTSTSESAASNVASIDKNKLEQQVNSIKTSDQSADNIAASNTTNNLSSNATGNNTPNKSTTDSVKTNPTLTNTTAKAFSDINKQYSADLAAAEKIKNKDDKEKEKATVLKKWAEAIDADVTKQKADYISETDPEMKALLAKKISDAENSSKEKNTQADQSLTKVKQTAIVANSTTENTATKDNANAINKSVDTTNSSSPATNKTAVVAGTENQFVYNNVSATEEMTKADLIDNQADTLVSYSEVLKSKAAKEQNADTKKLLLEQSNDILEQSKEKKIQAAQLNSSANKTEYASNKVQLDNLAKSYSTNTSDDISMADMNNDEALIYFEKAQKLNARADTTKSLDEKELLLKDANKNEMLALEKQKKSTDIYKNHDAFVAASSVNANTNVSSNPANANTSTALNSGSSENTTLPVNTNTTGTSKTTATALIDINKKYQADLAAAEKNTNEGDREKEKADVLKKWAEAIDADIDKQEQDYAATTDPEMKALLLKKISDAEISSKEKKTQAGQSLTKAETLKQPNVLANTSSDNIAVKDNEANPTGDQKSNTNNTSPVVNNTLPIKDNVFLPVTDNTTLPVKDNTAKTSETINANTNAASSENQITYKEPAAKEQILKAELLNKEADEVMGQSVELKSQAVKSKNTNTKNTIYAQSEELMKEGQDKKLQASQLTATANTTQFDSNQNELDQMASASSTNTSAEILKAEITNDEAKTFFDNAKKQRIKASTTESYSAKETELEAARKNEMSALEKQKEAMGIYKKYNPNFVASIANTSENNSTTNNSLNSGTSTNPVTNAAVNNSVSNTSTSEENADISSIKTSSSSEVTLSPNEVFDQKSTLVYSFNNPIPINKKLPEGLIFKVQIGAFRKPIPQDLFQGMSPITGETTPKGFIRYTVGVFEKFTTADKVKNKIIDMGYKDAFIVAFLNGKRIPINEAYAMAGGVPATVLQINNPIADTEKNTIVTTNDQPNIDQKTNELKAIAKTQSVTTVQGLFYTVQVGVFSQPVVAGKLYNMKPLYTETAANGNLRYYTGIYKSVSRAAEATEMINDVGIKDAFVTAYYNGKRISLAEAKQYEKQGDAVFSTGVNVNKLPVFIALPKQSLTEQRTIVDITDIVQPVANNSASNQINREATPSNTEADNSGIIYKIQIGAFNDEVPLEIANKFIKIASKGIKTYKDNNGLTVYTVGNLKTYDEANLLKSEVVAESLTDAFIIAFRNGEKIPVEEARK